MQCIQTTEAQRAAAKPWAIAIIAAKGFSCVSYLTFAILVATTAIIPRIPITGVWLSATWLTVRAFQAYCERRLCVAANLPRPERSGFALHGIIVWLMVAILVGSSVTLLGEAISWW